MQKTALITLAAVALSVSACGKKDETAVAPESGTATETLATSPAQTFANTMAASDAFEIETSRLAAEKATTEKIKAFAGKMIEAHTGAQTRLAAAAGTAMPPITSDPTFSPAQQQTLDALKAASGTAFDTAYAKAQVDGHQAALDALRSYSATGVSSSLQAYATDMIPTVTAHLNLAKGL